MGNMRLPTKDGVVDEEKAQEIIDLVYAQGVNYFDTAYMYHGGQSERFLGKALKKYPRDSYYLADKMPGFMLQPGQTPKDLFEEQLARCDTDYFDFYLCHNVSESTVGVYNDEEKGIIPYLIQEREAGRIRHLGFSSHGSPEMLRSFLDKWDCFEFVQIQLNYLDWTLQDAKQQYEIITDHGLPVWVMEPCRGGRLASLSDKADALLKAARPESSIASWAFRYVQSLPNVFVVLSGMTQLDQAQDNLETFREYSPLTTSEQATLQQALDLFRDQVNVPCTKCHYCDGCPKGLEIPELLSMYNTYAIDPGPMRLSGVRSLPEEQQPKSCIACGSCAKKCPQSIDIPGVLSKFAEIIETTPVPGPPPGTKKKD
jgi:predicted aldo/keto reductase-like oxidoreductase